MKRPDLSSFNLKPIPARPMLGVAFIPPSIKVDLDAEGSYLHGVEVVSTNDPLGPLRQADLVLGFNGTRVESTACFGIVLSQCGSLQDVEVIGLRPEFLHNLPVAWNVFKVTVKTGSLYDGGPSHGYGNEPRKLCS